ncbi:MAG: transglycosylase SLT domain-containing protein [Bryobacteraceae bacterium]|jgi:membrane-bound lytic murein transglycosylase D
MNARTQTLASIIVVAGASVIAGCGINQHSSFQNAFLPPHAHSGPVNLDIDHPPLVEPGVYTKDVPGFLLEGPQIPRRTRGDEMVEEAERHFAAGKQAYAIGAFATARQEFDLAVDAMLDASDLNPADRQAYDRRMDQMVDAIHSFDLAALGASDSSEEGRFDKAPLEDILQMTFPVDPKIKDRVLDQMAATVSQLPLSVTDAVLGYVNYFSNRGHGTIVVAMQRSGRYRPMIQRILDEEGVPQELIHLAQAESGFMPRAMSSARATGMWQFMAWRGAEYGLQRTTYTDDRLDPEKATRAAAHHLHDLYNMFGDWYLAIAAYDCGPQTVQTAVERTGYADFWELRARGELPIETTNYVPIILAMTIMEKNAQAYGLDQVQMDPPIEYDTVELTALTALPLIADVTDTSVPELTELNPALLGNLAPAHYAVHVPKGSGARLTAALALVPAEHRAGWRVHRVAPGETLAVIGTRFGVSTASLLAANSLPARAAVEGDLLVVPTAARPAPAARRVASKHVVASRANSHSSSHTASAAAPHRAPAGHPVAARPRAGAAPAGKPASPSAAARRLAPKPATLVAHSAAR